MRPIIERLDAEPIVDDLRTALGEGARWNGGRLRFVDYPAAALYAYDPASGALHRRDLDASVAAVAGTVATARQGFARLGDDGAVRLIGPALADGEREWLNDGRCDAAGRFWAATASTGEPGRCALYRLDADRVPRRMLGGLTFGNGIGFSPDGSTLYLADSQQRTVRALPLDPVTGALGAERTLVALDQRDGLPDGLAVDAEGAIWLAVWGAGEVRRYDARGTLRAVVAVPAANVTSCALGSGTLYITSAIEDDDAPHAGAVFAVPVGVDGLPEHGFAA